MYMPVGGLIPHTTSKVPYAPRYSTLLVGSCTYVCPYLCLEGRKARPAGRLVGWRLGDYLAMM